MTLSREQLKRLGDLHKEIASIYAEASNEKEVVVEAPVVEEPKKDNVVELPVNDKETVEEKAEELAEEETVEEKGKEAVDLESLSYNELKKLAKELGLSAKGTKAELVIRIQEAQGIEVADEDDEEEVVEEAPTTQEEETTTEKETEEVEDEEVVEEELPKTLHDEIMEQLEDYTTDELKEILESIDKPTKGKRQTLLALIVQAIEDGELDFGDDEESEEEEVEETEPTETEEVEETESDDEEEDDTDEEEVEEEDEEGVDLEDILEDLDRDQVKAICRKLEIKVLKKDTAESLKEKVMEYEDEGSLIDVLVDLGYVDLTDEEEDEEEDEVESVEPNYTGSKARISTMKKVYNNTLEELEEGDITPKQVKTLLDKYHNGIWKGTKEENNLEYARIIAELVDDEGDQVELEEAYYVGDDVYCCGAELKEVDEDLYCEHCGTTYEV